MEIDKKTIKALATESRLNILKALAKRRKMPSELSKELGLAPSTIIEHLNILEKADLVERKETGRKWIYYELTEKGINLIKPKFPVQFVVVLSIGVILMIFGSMNLTYTSFLSYNYPIITIERTITETREAPMAPMGTGVVENETITNKTSYETGYIEIQSINWLSLIIIIVGVIFITVSSIKLIKR
ncbi:MAG: ArsR/SmtB family transcription factor [Candidatus Aenigmatarchaeota archaeon]